MLRTVNREESKVNAASLFIFRCISKAGNTRQLENLLSKSLGTHTIKPVVDFSHLGTIWGIAKQLGQIETGISFADNGLLETLQASF